MWWRIQSTIVGTLYLVSEPLLFRWLSNVLPGWCSKRGVIFDPLTATAWMSGFAVVCWVLALWLAWHVNVDAVGNSNRQP